MCPDLRFVQSYVQQGRVGVLVEFGVETWPVTGSQQFLQLSQNVAMHVATVNPGSVGALLQQAYSSDPGITVQKTLSDASKVLGERISVIRFLRWANERQPLPDGRYRFIQSDVLAGSVGALVEFGLDTWWVTEHPEFLKLSSGLARYVAVAKPDSLSGLLHQAYAKDPAETVEKLLLVMSALLRQRITITRFSRWDGKRPLPDPKNPAVAIRLKRA